VRRRGGREGVRPPRRRQLPPGVVGDGSARTANPPNSSATTRCRRPGGVRAPVGDQPVHDPVLDPPRPRLQREPSRTPPARPQRPPGLDAPLRHDEKADGQPGRDPLGQPVDDMDELGGVRGERHGGVLVEERPDPVLDDGQPQLPHHIGEFTLPRPHRRPRSDCAGSAGVERGERRGACAAATDSGQQPFPVRLQRYQRDPIRAAISLTSGYVSGSTPTRPPGRTREASVAAMACRALPAKRTLLGVGPPGRPASSSATASRAAAVPGGGAGRSRLGQHIGTEQRRESGASSSDCPSAEG
jgi:hypothetical protein